MYDPKNKYFNWLCSKIKGHYYEEMLWRIYTIPFKIEPDDMDSSRAFDGFQLRDKFSKETGMNAMCTYECLEDVCESKYCTFLEMLVALAMRLDNDIMWEERYGDRYVDWFWMFVENMEMSQATNENWDLSWDRYVERRLEKILRRSYNRNGNGGMFVIKGRPDTDMRQVDIWRQMVWWLDENIREGVID